MSFITKIFGKDIVQ